jgi:hypothetical protein
MPAQENDMTPDEKMDIEKMRAEAMSRQGEVEESEDEMYAAGAPKGKFSGKALNSLVDATNRLLPLFGLDDKYDRFSGGATALPPEFMRLLTMFSKAMADAIDAGILPEDAMIDMKIVVDDNSLQALAGRLGMAAKSPGFKRFLLRKVSGGAPETEEAEEMSSDEMDSEGMDKLMMERMN